MRLNFKKLLPHLIAVALFFIIALVFCKPALEGKVLQQHDMVGTKGMEKNALDYKEKFGHLPLWNTNLFSGMPNYQVAIEGPNLVINFNKILTLGLPQPANYFFLACLCFYLLCISLKCNPYAGIFGSLAFAYATYDPIIISVGHITKMFCIAYAPALLAGLLWIYQKKYWIGIALTSLFATMEVVNNHPQINFYILIIAVFMTIAFIIKWINDKEYKHLAIALSLAALCGAIGVLNAGVTFLTTAEYTKYTMRGGKTIETTNGAIVQKKTTGLDNDYAFQYSISKSESVTLFMPNAFGGSSGQTLDENSNLVKQLTDKNIPEANAIQLASSLPKYWGGIVEGTAGPAYLGVLACLLFVIGLVILKTKHKWWIAAAVFFTLMMAWGKYFPEFNNFIFSNLPLYNKFRAPSMALVVSQILVPLLAVLCLQKIIFSDELNIKSFKKILYALVGVLILLILIYFISDYRSEIDKEILAAYNNAGGDIGKMIIKGLMADRKEMFGNDLLRVVGFAVLLVGLLYLRYRKILSPIIIMVILIFITITDLFIVDKKYLNDDSYMESDAYMESNFKESPANTKILEDKDPHYRVYNLSADRFSESKTSYYHRSIGGYHAAKLRIYQDIIENQLSKNPLNMAVLNMLDTKYFIIPDQQNPAINNVQKNDSTLGSAWFVKNIVPVNGPVEEIKALDNFDPGKTAFIDKSQNVALTQPAFDSTSKIKLTKYNNDEIVYETDAKSDQFAVLSEIYYPAGWNAYIDNKKTPYYKVNYILRGIPVPAGHHIINFKFEPRSYSIGYTMGIMGGILLYIMLIGGLIMSVRKRELVYPFSLDVNKQKIAD